jgi:hypothetical protein
MIKPQGSLGHVIIVFIHLSGLETGELEQGIES